MIKKVDYARSYRILSIVEKEVSTCTYCMLRVKIMYKPIWLSSCFKTIICSLSLVNPKRKIYLFVSCVEIEVSYFERS